MEDKVMELYAEGVPIKKIVERTGVPKRKVYKILELSGLERRNKWSNNKKRRVCLKCDRPFAHESYRLCYDCRESNSNLGPMAEGF